jgi:hypothetical protein
MLLGDDHLTGRLPLHPDDVTDGLAMVSLLAKSKLDSKEAGKLVSYTNDQEIDQPELGVGKLGHHSIGQLADSQGSKMKVLVEFKRYDDPLLRERLVPRIREITRAYKSVQNCDQFRLLSCRGFFHDDILRQFGLVYDFPSSDASNEIPPFWQAKTLRDTLNTKNTEMPLMSLEYRFKLAYGIAAAVSAVHKIGWLHKGLTSSSIILLVTPTGTIALSHAPYVTGFRHSRPNEPTGFTEGLIYGDDDVSYYQHPDYSELSSNYYPQYDYYSLGILLLEIGHWRALPNLVDIQKLSARGISEKLVSKRAPVLDHLMGNTYRCIVEVCLGEFPTGAEHCEGFQKDKCGDEEVQLQFETKVLSQLRRLCNLRL